MDSCLRSLLLRQARQRVANVAQQAEGLVGRLLSAGDPWARASEQQVRDFFARFGRWQGLAAGYALRAAGSVSPLSSR